MVVALDKSVEQEEFEQKVAVIPKLQSNAFNQLSNREKISILSKVSLWISWDNPTPDVIVFHYDLKDNIFIKSRVRQEWLEIERLEYIGESTFIAHIKEGGSFSLIAYTATKAFI